MTVRVFLIITVTAALFLYGCYVMKKLDAFSAEDKPEKPANLLRVAVEYTGMEVAIKSELEKLALQYPDYHLLISAETRQNILESIKRGKADIALLSGISHCASFRCLVKEYQTEQHDGLSNETTDTRQEVTVVWNHTGNNEILTALIALISDGNG